MVDFNKLRATRGGGQFQALQDRMKRDKANESSNKMDAWRPTRDVKTNTANVICRFLPTPKADHVLVEDGKAREEDLTPMVRILRHSFKTLKGRYYNNLSPKMLGHEDPVNEYAGPQWGLLKKIPESSPEYKDKKAELINYFADDEFFVNLLVIDDKQVPENNGKIVRFKVPKSVRDVLDGARTPKFAGDPSFDPFDLWEGAACSLRVVYTEKPIGGKQVWVGDYAGSVWLKQEPAGDDEFIEKLWSEAPSLLELYLGKVPTYEEAKKKFCELMGLDESYNRISGTEQATPPANTASFGGSTTETQSLTQPINTTPTQTAAPATEPAVQGKKSELEELEDMLK